MKRTGWRLRPMGRRGLAAQRGAALIVTIFVVALVTVLVLEYHFDTTVERELSEHYAQTVKAYQMALAGLQFARAVLDKDDVEYDSVDELWHNLGAFGCVPPEQMLALVKAAAEAKENNVVSLAGAYEEPAAPSETACVKITITDETAKLPLNALVDSDSDAIQEEWRAIFETFFADFEIDADAIDALIDWMDLSPGHLAGGAEDEYYEGLEPPYKTPDRPIEVMGELRLIRHFDCETLAKLFPGSECQHVGGLDLGANAYLTPYGGVPASGLVNLNTANDVVLRAVTRGDTACVTQVLEKRLSVEGQLISDPIRSLDDVSECNAIPDFEQFAGTTSTHFRVESEAQIEGLIKKKIVAVLLRDQGGAAASASPDASALTMVYFKIE